MINQKQFAHKLEATGCHRHDARAFTTGDRLFAKCQVDCRVFFFGHSAKSFFVECGKKHSAKKLLCRVYFLTLGKEALCRVTEKKHSAIHLALGKEPVSGSEGAARQRERLQAAESGQGADALL